MSLRLVSGNFYSGHAIKNWRMLLTTVQRVTKCAPRPPTPPEYVPPTELRALRLKLDGPASIRISKIHEKRINNTPSPFKLYTM